MSVEMLVAFLFSVVGTVAVIMWFASGGGDDD